LIRLSWLQEEMSALWLTIKISGQNGQSCTGLHALIAGPLRYLKNPRRTSEVAFNHLLRTLKLDASAHHFWWINNRGLSEELADVA